MKFLIYFLTFFLGSLFNFMIGEAIGFRFGAILLYLIEFYIAHRLCKAWEAKRQEKNQPSQVGNSYAGYTVLRKYKCAKCGKLGPYGETCPECGSSMKAYFSEVINPQNQVVQTSILTDSINTHSNCENQLANADETVPVKTSTTETEKANDAVNRDHPILKMEEDSVSTMEARPLFCRKCGTKLHSDSLYCNKCGTKIE